MTDKILITKCLSDQHRNIGNGFEYESKIFTKAETLYFMK